MRCELCGKPPHDEHHCLLGQKKKERKAIRDWLNNPFNIQVLCRGCHEKNQALYSNRTLFFNKQLELYGDSFLEWVHNAPAKIKRTMYSTRSKGVEFLNKEYKELLQMVKGIEK